MFSINVQFDINTKKIWKGWVNIWGAVAPLAPPISAYGRQHGRGVWWKVLLSHKGKGRLWLASALLLDNDGV